MIIKIAIPGRIQFKMMRRKKILLPQKGDVHYIGGAEVLPPLEGDKETEVISDLGTEYEDEAKAILIEQIFALWSILPKNLTIQV